MIFAFEAPEVQRLELLPLDVRRKLDLAGVKLSLAGWLALTLEARKRLVDAPVGDWAAASAYAELAHALSGDAEERDPVRFPPPWDQPKAGAAVAARAKELGLRAEFLWHGLSSPERFALAHLADPRRSGDALRAALESFDLLR